MSETRKKRCPHCSSLEVVRWGSKSSIQRFRCRSCNKTFTRTRPDISARNRLVWFREWVESGHTVEYISRRSGYSARTIKNYFYGYLKDYPVWHIRPAEKVNLLIDGTKHAYFLFIHQQLFASLPHLKYRPQRTTFGPEWYHLKISDLRR